MGRAHVSTHRSVGGRYRLVEITHRETNSVCWYADDLQTGRPCLVTQTGLPEDPGGAARRVPSRVLRTTESVSRLCPGRIATVVDAVGEDGSLWTVTAWIDGTPLGEVIAEQGTLNYVRTARIALELLDSGAWSGAGVLGPEAFDAAPFLALLKEYGSPWGMREVV